MSAILRIILTAVLSVLWTVLSAACVVGLLATREPMSAGARLSWQLIFGTAMLVLLAGLILAVVLLWRSPRA